MPPDTGFNNEQRIIKLIQLLQKHSIASTASFISNLYSWIFLNLHESVKWLLKS